MVYDDLKKKASNDPIGVSLVMQSFGMSHWLIPGSTQFSDVSKAKKVFIRFSSSIVNRETEARDTYLKIIMNGISVKRYIHINFLSENHIAFIYTYLPLSPMIMILSLSKYFRFWCSCAAATAASKVRRKKGNDTPVICVLLSLEHYKSVYISML